MDEKIAEGFKGEKAIILPHSVRGFLASNPVTEQLYVTHIGYYPHARYHFRERKNGSNQYILIYCAEGKGWILHNERKSFLNRDECYIIPAKEFHAYGSNHSTPWSIYWVHFLGNNVDHFSSIIGEKITVSNSIDSRHQERFQLFEEIYQNLDMGYDPANLEYTSYCLIHFLASLKYLSQYREIKKLRKTDVIQKSILFMKDHLENKMTLDDVANHVGYSASHFGSLFLNKTSYTPIEYYTQLKMQRACSYLQFSDLKIKEIAYKLEFCDPFHFSRSFKKEMNLTPLQYRKKYNP